MLPETLCRKFQLSEIISATDNFSAELIIGKGSYGHVYKGKIALVPGNTTTVAVKRRYSDSKQGLDEFWTEVKLLSRCRHAHLISLVGCCYDPDANEMILVYEYMPNGTLADHIYKKNEKSVLLSWEQRLKICIGVGRGLEYLQTGTGINQIVVHRDLKCNNVLLDADWEPRLSDFGLCKMRKPGAPVVSSVKGTRGYMDPHYCKTRELSAKTDVYAFGVVLLEVLCGRRQFDSDAADGQKRLVLWAEKCFREGAQNLIVDPGLRGSFANDGLSIFLDITLKCLKDRPSRRPTLAEVVGKLEIALAKQDTTYSSSSSVDDEIFKYFNQAVYSSTYESSDADPSRRTVETWSSKSDNESKNTAIIRRHNELKSSSENNALEALVDLQSTQAKANVSIPATSKAFITLSNDKDDEYENLFRRMNPLSVVIDNESYEDATVILVNGINTHQVLLEIVQVLTDIDFVFTRASITSDGLWSTNVFRVTDPEGNKVTDEKILEYIQKDLGSGTRFTNPTKSVELPPSALLTVIELIGSDRPGLLSEVCTVLFDLRCNIVNANVWTHNTRAAFIILLTDDESGTAITDPMRLYTIKTRLCNVLTVSSNNDTCVNIVVTHGVVHAERRLHQMMLADRDYARGNNDDLDQSQRADVNVVNWCYKDCSVVTIRCPDRPRLMFDTICALIDMDYVVLHGYAKAERTEAFQEYFIRNIDGSSVKSDAERGQVIQCIKAAIERRVFEGLKLELYTKDRIGLLSYVTRIFHENSLTITRAEVETWGEKAVDTFYVRDASGSSVDSKIIRSIRKQIGQPILKVKHNPQHLNRPPHESTTTTRFLFGSIFKFLYQQYLNS